MANGWSGGQYSLFRVALGLYLLVHFGHLAPWSAEVFSSAGMLPSAELSPLTRAFPNVLALVDHPAFVIAFCMSGAVASVALIAGRHDRIAALWCWYVLACLFGRNPLIQNPSLPYTGWMLLLHAALPRAPYGSLAARGRSDPGGTWAFSPPLFAAAWIVLAISYSYSGWTKLFSPTWVSGDTVTAVLNNPLARDWMLRDVVLMLPPVVLKLVTWFILYIELLFAPLALWARARPWIWLGMLLVQIGLALLLSFPDLTFAMLLFHLVTFDPAWLGRKSLSRVTVLFDGSCALCHATVRFLLAEDALQELRFAPLGGEAAHALIAECADLPVSMLVHTADGRVLVEDDGLLHLLDAFGGLWRVLAIAARVLPKPLRRRIYSAIGNRRHRLFGRTTSACPRVSSSMRKRILV